MDRFISTSQSEPLADAVVYIVDDDVAFCEQASARLMPLGTKVKTAGTAEAFLQEYDPSQPCCLILDFLLPGINGLELQAKESEHGILPPIIFVTEHADVPLTVRAMRAGAVTVLKKPIDDVELIPLVRKAIDLDVAARRQRERHASVRARYDLLTPREKQVVALVVTGKQTKQIAFDLGISPRTIDVHRAHIMSKLGIRSLADMIAIAAECRIAADTLPPENPGST